MTNKKLQTKITSIEKKITTKQDALELARERRRSTGNRLRGDKELKIEKELDALHSELRELKRELKSQPGQKEKVTESIRSNMTKESKLRKMYESAAKRSDTVAMYRISNALSKLVESEQQGEQYDYKFWDEMTPYEKAVSYQLGQGVTVWNERSRRYAVKFPVPKNLPVDHELTEADKITADELNEGDEVIITGNVQYNGATGVIDSFGRDKAFVVVDLYNHGKHSFHSSDVSFNEYAGSEEEDADWRDQDGIYESRTILKNKLAVEYRRWGKK